MKHTFKRLLAWGMALCVLMSVLAGCAGGGGAETTGAAQEQTEPSTGPSAQPSIQPSTEATEPPTEATEAPTAPPATEPPATQPPVTEPPVTEPPVTEPPITEPPVTQPPVTEPPKPENDVGKEIAGDGFAITVLSAEQEENRFTVVFTLSYTGEGTHGLSAKDRIFVVNSDRRSLAVDNIYDTEGNSLLGASIQAGQKMTIRAVFTLTEGFVPSAFRYIYDIMGFRRLQAAL